MKCYQRQLEIIDITRYWNAFAVSTGLTRFAGKSGNRYKSPRKGWESWGERKKLGEKWRDFYCQEKAEISNFLFSPEGIDMIILSNFSFCSPV